MGKNRVFLVLCFIALAIGSVAWGRHRQSVTSPQKPPAQEAAAQLPEVPDYVAYLHAFRHIATFKKKAEEMERGGKNGSAFGKYFKRKAELSDMEAQTLDAVASECDQELSQLDARAKVLIDAYKAQYPGGQVPHGELPKPPPDELRGLTEERNALVLRYRDRLHAYLGDGAFNRFHSFVQRHVAPNISTHSPGQPSAPAQSNAQ